MAVSGSWCNGWNIIHELTPPVLGSGGYTDETKASLFAAIDVRDISTVRKIIAKSGFPHFHYNDDGTALHLAAQRDALEIMRLLLSYTRGESQCDLSRG